MTVISVFDSKWLASSTQYLFTNCDTFIPSTRLIALETPLSDCTFLACGGVDLYKMDLSPTGQDHRDPLILLSVTIDPGTAGTLTPDSLCAVNTKRR